jgi:hypothetical protein
MKIRSINSHSLARGRRGRRDFEEGRGKEGMVWALLCLEIYKQKSPQVFIKCAKYKPPWPRGTTYIWYLPLLRERDLHILYTLTHTCTRTQAHTIDIGSNWRRNQKVPLLAGSLSF